MSRFEPQGFNLPARREYPHWFIGLNFLGCSNDVALTSAVLMAAWGLWSDDAGLVENVDGSINVQAAASAWKTRQASVWGGKYFGGVAFKYRQQVRRPGEVARAATPFMDVVTTSGDATGQPPTLEKVCEVRDAIGDFPLAVASGITPENVAPYLPYINYFLVATGISHSFHELDLARVRRLADMMQRD